MAAECQSRQLEGMLAVLDGRYSDDIRSCSEAPEFDVRVQHDSGIRIDVELCAPCAFVAESAPGSATARKLHRST